MRGSMSDHCSSTVICCRIPSTLPNVFELRIWRLTCAGDQAGMVMDMEMQEYKVVVAGRNSTCGKNLVTEVYCSLTRRWKDVDNDYPVEHHYQTSAVYSNGCLYSAGYKFVPRSFNLVQVRIYDQISVRESTA